MSNEDEFLRAVKHSHTQTLIQLLRLQPELVRIEDEYGKTALHWAAETNQVETARLLADAGADIEAMTSWGATPLDWAATMGSVEVGELLLARGASGFTLIVAAALGKLEDVKSIVERQTNLTAQPQTAASPTAAPQTAAPHDDLSTHRRRGAPQFRNDDWPADSAHIQGDVISPMRCTRLLATATPQSLIICSIEVPSSMRRASSAALPCTGLR